MPRLQRLRDEFVKNAAGAAHNNFYQLMQTIVEANSISERLNKHAVRSLLLELFSDH